MGYSESDFQDSYHDDPIEEISKTKSHFKFLTTGAVILGSVLFFQSTLAGNISLSSGTGIEFGQGFSQAVACSGNTDLTLTPRSTFTNASPGAHYLNSVTVSNIPTSCYGVDFTINAYNDSSSTPLAIFNATSKSAVVYNNAGTFSGGIGSTGMTLASSAGTFTATFTAPVALASNVFKLTIQSGAHTPYDSNPSYVVGDRGPGGGIVYYVSVSNFTSTGSTCSTACKYLEVAPTSGTNAWTEAYFKWSGNTDLSGSIGTTGTAIGTGYANTLANVGQASGGNTAERAGTKTRAYRGPNDLSDWFLPSKDELNQMCKWQRGITGIALTTLTTRCAYGVLNSGLGASGFIDSGYWSSSEYTTAGNAWWQYWANGTQGNQSNINKGNEFYVRPVRAF